jgi:hypothetical protein
MVSKLLGDIFFIMMRQAFRYICLPLFNLFLLMGEASDLYENLEDYYRLFFIIVYVRDEH